MVSTNRIALTRAGWARDACEEILRAEFATDSMTRRVDSIALGEGVWCRAELTQPSAKLNLNWVPPALLRRLLRNDSLVEALLDWRDGDETPQPAGAERRWYQAHGLPIPRNGSLETVAELGRIRGYDSLLVARLQPLVTVDGSGGIDVTAAPREVLQLVPGLTNEAVELILLHRQ